jgi:hypothetical protein
MTIFKSNNNVDKEMEALKQLRAEREAKQSSKKIVFDEPKKKGDVPDIYFVIKTLIDTKSSDMIDDNMLKGINREDVVKYLKSEKYSDRLIPAILKRPAPAPTPTPAPTPKVDALPAEKPKAKGKPGPKPKTQKDPNAPKQPRKKREEKYVDPATKRLTPFQVLNPIWKIIKMLKTATPDQKESLEASLDAYKIGQPFKHISPATIHKFFLARGADTPDWLQNYGYVPTKAKKPVGRPSKAKPIPEPEVDTRLQKELINIKNENKFLFKTNELIRRENEEKNAKLLEAQRFINELENTLRDYEMELAKCRAENTELKNAVPARTPKKKAPPPPKIKLNPMTEEQYRLKQQQKNESGLMETELPEPAVKNPTITKTQSTDLLNLLNDLETKGNKYEKTGIHFKANHWLGSLMYLYLIKKYNISCFIYGTQFKQSYQEFIIDLGKFGLLGSKKYVDEYYEYLNKIIQLIVNCIKKIQDTNQELLIIPLTIYDADGSHANMLIYRKSLNVIEHYEPHGSKMVSELQTNEKVYTVMTKVISDINSTLDMNINYIPPSDICPTDKGFQTIENELVFSNKIEKEGFCMIWSIFFAEMSLMNPMMTGPEIFNRISDILKSDPLKTKTVIRGYLSYLYDSIIDVVGSISEVKDLTHKKIVSIINTNKFEKKMQSYIQSQFKTYNDVSIDEYFKLPSQKKETEMMGAEDVNVAKDESSKLFSFFHNLQVKGKEYEATGIQYEPNGQMINILTYYLNNKYGLSCRIRGKNNRPITFDLSGSNSKVNTQFEFQLAKCITELPPDQNIMFIPIGMKISDVGFHANMLIYRKDTNRIEHYDPNGETQKFKKLTSILRSVFEKMNIEYYPSTVKVGFQRIESLMKKTLGPDIIEREGNEGFCIMWSFLIAEMALANPAMSTDDILQYLLSKITKTNQNLFLRNIIRGYIHYLYESLSAFLKDKYNIDLDLTQKVEKSKILNVIKELDKVYDEPKTQAREREMMGAEDVNILKFPDPTVICDDNNYCIAFGKSDKVLKLFDDLNFKYVSQMKTLSSGVNGFLLTINYEKQPYKLSTILKSSTRNESSNLAYEYIVGQMINRYNKLYPCFIETYHLFKYKTIKNYNTIQKKYKKTINNTTPDTDYLQNGLEMVNTKFDLSNIDTTLINSRLFCTQIQYIENAKTLRESLPDIDFIKNELTNVLFQVYAPLSYMYFVFTHYDLHTDNVLVLKPYADMYFEYMYHLSPTNIVTFNSQYIAKIIDYGNAYFNNLDGFNTSSLVQVLKQKTTPPKIDSSGYYNIAYSTQITPQESNFSADLRLLSIIKKMYKSGPHLDFFKDVVFKGPYSTPINDKYDGKINNILHATRRLEAEIKKQAGLSSQMSQQFKKVGTIHVYMDNKTPMKYVSAI